MARTKSTNAKGVYQRNNNWYVRYKSPEGKDVRKSFGSNRKAATDYADKVQLIGRSGEGVIPSSARGQVLTFKELELKGTATTVADIADSYLKYVKAHPTEYKDQKNPPRMVRDIKQKFGERSATTVKPHEIDDWLDEIAELRRLSPATVNRIKATFSGIYSRAVQRSQVPTNPVKAVKQRRVSNGVIRFLSAEEESRLRAAIEKWRETKAHLAQYQPDIIDHHICELDFAIGSGARKGEQYGLQWPEVDFTHRRITLIDTKNGESRVVEMIDDVYKALKRLQKLKMPRRAVIKTEALSEPVFAIGDNKKWWAQAVKDAKIKNFRWHDLRHTFCSRLAMAGVNLKVIQEAAGHKTIQMTARYAHLDRTTMRSAMSVLNRPASVTAQTN